jgi:hypothetical protein
MRRQLSQPSFVNGFARSKGESVRPDLWPYHAWIPAYGIQGDRLLDISGRINPSLANGAWVMTDGMLCYGKSDANVTCDVRKTTTIAPPYSVVMIVAYSTGDGFAYSRGLSTSNTPIFGIDLRSGVNGFIRDSSSGGGSWGSVMGYDNGRLHQIAMVWESSAVKRLYVDGALKSTNTNASSDISVDRGALFCLARNTKELYQRQFVALAMEGPMMLSEAQVTQLYIDPLLPFRRKIATPVFIPSGAPPAGNAHNIFNSPIFGKKLVG